jgi:hypothetical protein
VNGWDGTSYLFRHREITLTVFKAFSDESDVGDRIGTFLIGGYVASEKDWPDFSAAWQERVLDGPPIIPYLHMREILGDDWRQTYGISYNDSEERISEAVRVIFSSGNISAIGSHLRKDDLKLTIQPSISANHSKTSFGKIAPDYPCYIAYVSFLLDHVRMRYPEAEKVNFVVSSKNSITEHISDFHAALKLQIAPPLDTLMGDMIPGEMEKELPLQAADLLCWHMQRYFANKMNCVNESRLWYLGESSGICHQFTCKDLQEIANNIWGR